VVLLDDMASTGHTLAQAARLLLQDGAASVDVAVTHALIDAEALAALHAAGRRRVLEHGLRGAPYERGGDGGGAGAGGGAVVGLWG
jgi:orotate phosphoribosyltransferase